MFWAHKWLMMEDICQNYFPASMKFLNSDTGICFLENVFGMLG